MTTTSCNHDLKITLFPMRGVVSKPLSAPITAVMTPPSAGMNYDKSKDYVGIIRLYNSDLEANPLQLAQWKACGKETDDSREMRFD